MEIFLDGKMIAIGFIINILVSIIKPFIKLKKSLVRKTILKATVIVLAIISAVVYHLTGTISVNPLFVDFCIIAATSFIIYQIGYKEIVEKVKGKL